MNDALQQALIDTLTYLRSLIREGSRLEEAKMRLHSLRQRHPEIGIELLWEEESYDRSLHYDALLHLQGEGTVSMSFCPEHSLPWPLRGIHRWKEQDLVQVNNTVLTVERAIAYLDFIWDESRIVKGLVDVCLIQEAFEKDPIELSQADLQSGMDSFRRAHKLYKAEDTYQWLEQHGTTQEKLEDLVAEQLMVANLRDRVTASRLEAYFKEHQTDFDTAYITRLEFPDCESAQQEWEQICTGTVDFYKALEYCFLAVERSPHLSSNFFSVVQRGQMSPDLAAAVFASAPGEVLEPVDTGACYAIIRVLSVVPARLDEPTRNAIKKLLFEEWLAERRQAAKIDWYWGKASQTSQQI